MTSKVVTVDVRQEDGSLKSGVAKVFFRHYGDSSSCPARGAQRRAWIESASNLANSFSTKQEKA